MNMDRYNVGEKRLIAPDNYTSAGTSRNNQKDLVPPSHFESSAQLPRRAVQLSGTVQAPPWIHSGTTSGDPGTPNPCLAISQAQEILELRRENERLMRLQKENPRENVPVLSPSDSKTRFRWESEWRLEAERHKEEAERLKMQVEVLKSSVERHWKEIRDRDNTMKRQIHDLEAVHEELSKTKSELRQTREELVHSSAQKEKISSQLERLREEAAEESTRLRRDAERSKEEARECALRAEMCRLQAEEEAKQQALKLSEQLSELHQKHEVERQLLNTSHQAELATLGKKTNELQDRLESMTSELLPLKSTLKAITTERDGLKQHLSQMGQAFETQSATLHSLRNYIGQLAPENGEKERLNDTVERLNREKVALQMANELLTIRLNSVNEMLTLQEEKVVEKTLTHPLGKNSEGLQVLHLWREKVFKLCVQLRTKDIEVNEQKHKLVSNIRSLEQELQQEQHRARLLQHGLDDRIAELDLERVAKETLKQDLAFGQKENLNLKSQNKKVEAELKVLTEAVRRFSQAFESKVADVDSAITRLSTLTQRLAFAKGRVETIQGLVLRKNALRKVQQAGKQSEHPNESVPKLQTELHLVYEERDKLTKELKRTPELIEKALTELREQYESKLGHRQQELEQSWAEVRRAVAGRDEAEHNLQLTQAHLGECRVDLEELSSELLRQQERSDRALVERVSEIESRCAEKLREMEFRVNTAEKEHTKAVKILRQFERQATWKQDEPESKRREIQDEPLREAAGDKARLKTSVDEAGLMGECTRSPTANSEGSPPGMAHQEEARLQQPAHEKLLSLLEELRALSAAVISSSEGSSEEEEEEEKLTAQDDHL